MAGNKLNSFTYEVRLRCLEPHLQEDRHVRDIMTLAKQV